MKNTSFNSSYHHNPLEIYSSRDENLHEHHQHSNSFIRNVHHHSNTTTLGNLFHRHLPKPAETIEGALMVTNKFTNFQAFMMNGQARGDFMNYLRERENDENIVFVDEIFQMRENIRKVIRMFLYEKWTMNHDEIRKNSNPMVGNESSDEGGTFSTLLSQLFTKVETIHQRYLLGNIVGGGIMLNTSNTILERARKDYSIFIRLFNMIDTSSTALMKHQHREGKQFFFLLEGMSRFCNYLLSGKDHKVLQNRDLEKLKKILISDECTLESLSSQINFSEKDLDDLLRGELFSQQELKWHPFKELMNEILHQIQVECFDEYKSTDQFENFVRMKIQELNSEQMYKLFCQNAGIQEGTVNGNFVGDYMISKKKKRRSIVDVILRRRPTIEESEEHNVRHSDADTSDFLGLDPLNTDLREWYYPVPIAKWTIRHLIVFISQFCNFEEKDLEIYCKRIEKKNIVGLDLMCLLSVVNGVTSSMGNLGSMLSKDPAQHLFNEMKMKNHDHQQRFFSNLVDYNRKRMLMKRRSSINLLEAHPVNEKLLPSSMQHQHVSAKDLYVPLVNEDHLIIKVISSGTDESRVFSIDRNISLESLHNRIEEEFKNSKLMELMGGSLFDLKSLYTDDGHAIRDQFHLFEYLSSKRTSIGQSPRREVSSTEYETIDSSHIRIGSAGRIIGSSYSKEDDSILFDRASFEKSLGDVFGIENSVHEETELIEQVEPFKDDSVIISSQPVLQTMKQQEPKTTEEDGFKRLFIQPSCDKKFQRRSVVY